VLRHSPEVRDVNRMEEERLEWQHVDLTGASVFDGRVSSELRARGTSAARLASIMSSLAAVKDVRGLRRICTERHTEKAKIDK
jgi:hypothetical protein